MKTGGGSRLPRVRIPLLPPSTSRIFMGKYEQDYIDIIYSSDLLTDVLGRLEKLMKTLGTEDYLLSGGAVYQTVWNHVLSKDPHYGLKDLDVVYYDNDTSKQKEIRVSGLVQKELAHQKYPVEAVNQARVHQWYKETYGFECRELVSLEDAVGSWMVACCCIGIRKEGKKLIVFAPYGLDDIFNLIIRPNNKTEKSRDIYYEKAEKWLAKWPELTVLPW